MLVLPVHKIWSASTVCFYNFYKKKMQKKNNMLFWLDGSYLKVHDELKGLAASIGVASINDPAFALAMDARDPLREVRSQYFIPKASDIIRTAQDPTFISSPQSIRTQWKRYQFCHNLHTSMAITQCLTFQIGNFEIVQLLKKKQIVYTSLAIHWVFKLRNQESLLMLSWQNGKELA